MSVCILAPLSGRVSRIPEGAACIAALAFVLLALAPVGQLPRALAFQPGGGPPPAQVVFGEARIEIVEQLRPVTGEVRAHRRSVLAAEEDGLVVEIDVDAGDRVEAGQVIAKLDDSLRAFDVRAAEASVRSREASVAEFEAELRDAQLDLDRLLELRDRESASLREVDRARTLVEASEARVSREQADLAADEVALARAQSRLADLEIRAPFRGVVLERRTEVGQWLSRGDAVAEIVALDTLEAWVDVPESSLTRLMKVDGVSPEVRVFVSAIGREVVSVEYTLVPQVNPLSRQFPVRIEINNEGWQLRPGMSCTGLIPTGTQGRHLTVPKDALLRDDAGEFLFFDADGVAAVARVQRLFGYDGRVAIRDGALPPGARVIVRGNERVFPGQPLVELPSAGILSEPVSGSVPALGTAPDSVPDAGAARGTTPGGAPVSAGSGGSEAVEDRSDGASAVRSEPSGRGG